MTPADVFERYRRLWAEQGEGNVPTFIDLPQKTKWIWERLVAAIRTDLAEPYPVQVPVAQTPPPGTILVDKAAFDKVLSELKREKSERHTAQFQSMQDHQSALDWKVKHDLIFEDNARLKNRIARMIQDQDERPFRQIRRTVRHGFYRIVRPTVWLQTEDVMTTNRNVESTGFLCESQEMEWRIASSIECAPDLPVAEIIGWIQQARKAQKMRALRAAEPERVA